MAQAWFDSKGCGPEGIPSWAGAEPLGVELSSPGGALLVNDFRAGPGYNRSLQLIASEVTVEAVLKFRCLRDPVENLQLGGPGVALRVVDSDNFVEVSAGSGSSWALGNVRERLVGNSDDNQVAALFSSGRYAWRMMRVQAQGTVVRVRGWEAGQPEPSTWATEHTLAGSAVSGAIHLMLPYAAHGCWQIDYLALGTGVSAPPEHPLGVVNGIITDEFENTAARTIRLYLRETGELLDEVAAGLDGTYVLHTSHTGQHYVTVIGVDAPVIESDYSVRTIV